MGSESAIQILKEKGDGSSKTQTAKRSDHVQAAGSVEARDRATAQSGRRRGLRSGRDDHRCNVAALQADQGRARRCPTSGPETEWPHNRTFDGETAVRIFSNFSAALRRAESLVLERGLERGKGRSFVVQDKATAVRYGIVGLFPNELAAFFSWSRS